LTRTKDFGREPGNGGILSSGAIDDIEEIGMSNG
jgi:hypothetical protein